MKFKPRRSSLLATTIYWYPHEYGDQTRGKSRVIPREVVILLASKMENDAGMEVRLQSGQLSGGRASKSLIPATALSFVLGSPPLRISVQVAPLNQVPSGPGTWRSRPVRAFHSLGTSDWFTNG